MNLVFDASVLIAIEKGDEAILQKLKKLSKDYPASPVLPFIIHFEFSYGLKKRKPKKIDKLFEFLNSFNLLEITSKTSDILSDLKLKYDKKGISFSLTDLLIASQVIENRMVLVTMDKDFEKIKELNKIFLN